MSLYDTRKSQASSGHEEVVVRSPQNPIELRGFNDITPVWYFLKAFGIDPAQAKVEELRGTWGAVKVARNGVFGLEPDSKPASSELAGRELKQAVLESAYAVFDSRSVRQQLNLQGLSDEQGLEYLYLLTDEFIPKALVWVLPGGVFDYYFFYPLQDPAQAPLWEGTESGGRRDQDYRDSGSGGVSRIEELISTLYNVEGSICRGGIPRNTLGMGEPGGLVRSFSNGTAFPTVFTLDHLSSKTFIEILRGLIGAGVVTIDGEAVSEIGCGAGWIAAQMALLGAGSVHAYDLNLLKAANAAATARRYGVDQRFHAYRSRSATVLSPSSLYVWNIPDFRQAASPQVISATTKGVAQEMQKLVPEEIVPEIDDLEIMDQSASISANNCMLASDARKVFDQLAENAPTSASVLLRINSHNKQEFLGLLEGSRWGVHQASYSMPGGSQEGGAYYLLSLLQ